MPRWLAGLDASSSSSQTPATSTRAPPTPPPSAPPLQLGYYEDELVAGAIVELVGSSAQPRPSSSTAPPLSNNSQLVSGVLHVVGDFVDVETGQQQRRRAFTVVVQPPPPQRSSSSAAAWRGAARAVWRFCGVVAQAVVGLVLLVVGAVLLLLVLFVVFASAVEWCRGHELCH